MRERGLKYLRVKRQRNLYAVAPVRERGLKLLPSHGLWQTISRSREGAWIEMLEEMNPGQLQKVAPVRERGLK